MMDEPETEVGKKLYNDLAFAAPELWGMHIDKRIEEAKADGRHEELDRLQRLWHDVIRDGSAWEYQIFAMHLFEQGLGEKGKQPPGQATS